MRKAHQVRYETVVALAPASYEVVAIRIDSAPPPISIRDIWYTFCLPGPQVIVGHFMNSLQHRDITHKVFKLSLTNPTKRRANGIDAYIQLSIPYCYSSPLLAVQSIHSLPIEQPKSYIIFQTSFIA